VTDKLKPKAKISKVGDPVKPREVVPGGDKLYPNDPVTKIRITEAIVRENSKNQK
jgi:hypothetical protein